MRALMMGRVSYEEFSPVWLADSATYGNGIVKLIYDVT